jgi:hypothetical protein
MNWPVQEVRGKIDHDRKLSELLQDLACGDGRVVGSATACHTIGTLLGSATACHIIVSLLGSTTAYHTKSAEDYHMILSWYDVPQLILAIVRYFTCIIEGSIRTVLRW